MREIMFRMNLHLAGQGTGTGTVQNGLVDLKGLQFDLITEELTGAGKQPTSRVIQYLTELADFYQLELAL